MIEYILNKIVEKILENFSTFKKRDIHIYVRKEIYVIFKKFFENKLNCEIQSILETDTPHKSSPFEEETYYNYFTVIYDGIELKIDCYCQYLEDIGYEDDVIIVFNKIKNKNTILFTLSFNNLE
jgi:hypothetical protein